MKVQLLHVDNLNDQEDLLQIYSADGSEQTVQIAKSVWYTDEIFPVLKKLYAIDKPGTLELVATWVYEKAIQKMFEHCTKLKITDARLACQLYADSIVYGATHVKDFIGVAQYDYEKLTDEIILKLLRSYYPKLGKKTKLFNQLWRYVIDGYADGCLLRIQSGIPVTLKVDEQVS